MLPGDPAWLQRGRRGMCSRLKISAETERPTGARMHLHTGKLLWFKEESKEERPHVFPQAG